jgi:RNA polymerase sigma factor (sigma-70 family)
VYRFASDEHLVDRVRAGSASAFEALFDRHHRPLLAFCRHMLGSSADAEDAVQHTFMAAYADLMRSDKPIALRPWLYSIARHRCVSMLRSRRERPVAELPEPEVDHLAAEVYAREELRATLSDIAHLPDDQRAALILAELGDASHAEIAQVLGCRQQKVKALVFQARSSLATGRVARDTPCAEIREQLASGGLAVRRTFLRQHVRDCPGCREFGELVRLQRRRLRVLLPVAPSIGLKRAVLGAVLSSGGGASGVTAVVGALGVGGLAATAMVAVTVASSGGPPAPAASAAGDPPLPAMTTSARPDRLRRQAAPGARVRVRLQGVARRRPGGVSRRGAEQSRSPAAGAAPATGTDRAAPRPAAPAPTAPAAAPPAAGHSASQPPGLEEGVNPPGHERRRTPPDPPGKPSETPGADRPPSPPGGGKPAEPPGKPAEPPGKPAEPPGKPAEPPGNPDPGPPADGPDQRPSDPEPARPRR